jgi:hydrogenase maturation factor
MDGREKREAVRGMWVRITGLVLEPHQRSGRLPAETRKVPLEMWTKGFLISPGRARAGDAVVVETAAGRRVTGILLEVEPAFHHDFGDCVPELLEIGRMLRDAMTETREEGGRP